MTTLQQKLEAIREAIRAQRALDATLDELDATLCPRGKKLSHGSSTLIEEIVELYASMSAPKVDDDCRALAQIEAFLEFQ